jgi:hypothetical protein
MVAELVQTRQVLFDPRFPKLGGFPLRGGVTLIVSAPEVIFGAASEPQVRFAIGKPLTGPVGHTRERRQREYYTAMGLANGNTDDPAHFQADFGLLHMGISS